ncbi:hypothetical protein D0T49_10100 [Paludibacter sp. 221]|uniref:metallophosphoesterase n=1 Tax=Paludibacter sp. 221 TaxID=2302939 RepID=UPI0013D3B9BB|nr:metallophosphoesterase [Paludibacter sp. 221]NDV47397.1 hypothetical protein [Paludibacter sp. 221]
MKKINILISFVAILFATMPVLGQNYVLSTVAAKEATYLNVDKVDQDQYFLQAGGDKIVTVESNLNYSVKSNANWCKVAIITQNLEKVLKITAEQNTGDPLRTAVVELKAKDGFSVQINVTQLGKTPNILVSEKSINIAHYNLNFSIGISSNVDFTFELPAWIKTSVAPALGFKEYTFSADPIELSESERKGNIVIKPAGAVIANVIIPVTLTHEGYLSFAVISDVHFGNSKGEGPMKKVPQALKNLTSQKPLDAIFVVGDLTESGDPAQYTQFVQVFGDDDNFIKPVTRKVYMLGNHDNYKSRDNYINGLKPLNDGKAYPLDQYMVIKGYPFITISQRTGDNTDATTEANGPKSYPKEVQDTLSSWMARAAAECPGKPIFVFTHVPLKYTCYSSWPGEGDGTSWPTWSMKVLNPIVNQYPQAVVFGGHSHFPIGDPRSIHQGVNPESDKKNFFTGINTGSTTYSEIHKPSVDAGIHPEKYDYVTEGMILTAQPNGDIKIQRYDTYRNKEMHPEKPWVLKAPHDGSMFEYADIRDKDDNVNNFTLRDGLPAPVFAQNAVVTISDVSMSSVKVTFPQATDNENVFRYTINIKNTTGSVVKTFSKFSQFYLTVDMPKTLSVDMTGLKSNTTYTAEIIAYDSYENASTALVSAPFKTQEDNDPANQPPARNGSWLFNDATDLLKATVGQALTPATETASGGVTEKSTAAKADLVSIEGPSAANKAITVPKLSLLKLNHGISSQVSTYTIMYDVRISDNTKYHCLLQTALDNKGDGDFFINKSAQLGLSVSEWGYGGKIEKDTWYRIVLVLKDGVPTSYINGSLVKVGTGVNDRWKLAANATLLFADDNGEDDTIDVAEIAFWNVALTASQIINLGDIE